MRIKVSLWIGLWLLSSLGSNSLALASKPVVNPPTNLKYSQNPASYFQEVAITSNVPSSTGGAIDKYDISPALPSGLKLDHNTGIISGTPKKALPTTLFQVIATNKGGSASVSLSITVAAARAPAVSYSQSSFTFIVGTAVSIPAPSNTGGVVTSYAISPALPSGLSLNSSTGVISGTPLIPSPTTPYSVTASNPIGSSSAALTLTINNIPPSNLSYSQNPAIYTKGSAIPNDTPTSSGGAVVSYSITPNLPTGLSLNALNGVISGTPSSVSSAISYTVTASNSGGSTTTSISITVNDVPPSGLSYSKNPAVYQKGTPIANNTPSSAGGAVTHYGITNTLPTGLNFDSTTGILSGTPTQIAPTASYTVTASNSGGQTQASLSITVNDLPPVISYSIPAYTLTVESAFSVAAPSNTGGQVVSYSVSPSLPNGVAIDSSTGIISGASLQASPLTSYQVTATNSGGSSSAQISFVVNAAGPPVLATTFTDNQLFSQPVVTIPITVTSPLQVATTITVNGTQVLQTQSNTFSANITLSVGKNQILIQATDQNGQSAQPLSFTDLVFNPPALDSGLADPAVISPAFNMPTTLSDALQNKLSTSTALLAYATGQTDPFSCSNGVTISPPSSQTPDLSAIDPIAQVTPDIQTLANELGSADQAYFYVRDQIAFLPRFGLTQTASQTLASKVGTAADKAAALISLLRAMNVPAQYVAGDILVDENLLKNLYGVDGTNDLAWAQYMSLKGYFQALYPSGFDEAKIVYYENGKRAWQIPHVWVYAALQTQPGTIQWMQIDPNAGMTDSSAPGLLELPYQNAVASIGNFLIEGPVFTTITDQLESSWPTLMNVGQVGLTTLGPSVQNGYSVIPSGSISVASPCTKLQSDFLPMAYEFTSHVKVIDPANPNTSVLEGHLPLAALSQKPLAITFSPASPTTSGNVVLTQGSQTVASAPSPQGSQFSLYHAIQEPLAYGGSTEARLVNNRPVGGVFVIRHAVAPVPESVFYSDLHSAQAAVTGSSNTVLTNPNAVAAILELGSSLALTRASADSDFIINRYRGISRYTEHLLVSNTANSTLIPTKGALLGTAPINVDMDWDNTGPMYSRTGNYMDFTLYGNIANAKGELVVANSSLEGHVWNDLFGSGGTSAPYVLWQAFTDPNASIGKIQGTALTPATLSTITGDLSPNLSNEASLLSSFASESPYLFSITDVYQVPSGWKGAAFIIVPSSSVGQAGAYLMSQSNTSLLGGNFTNGSCTTSGDAQNGSQTCTFSGEQDNTTSSTSGTNVSWTEWQGGYTESWVTVPDVGLQYTENGSEGLASCTGSIDPGGPGMNCYVCQTIWTYTTSNQTCSNWTQTPPPIPQITDPAITGNQNNNNSPTNTAGLSGDNGPQGGGCKSTSPNNYAANPVNLASGTMWHEFVDMNVPGRTPKTALLEKRTYTTKPVQASNDFGPGWWHNWETQLLFPTSTTGFPVVLPPAAQALLNQISIVLPLPDLDSLNGISPQRSAVWLDEAGGPWSFILSPELQYIAPAGLGATLGQNGNTFVLTKRDGTQLVFAYADPNFDPPPAPTGKLLSLTEPHGETLQLAYDSSGKLLSVTGPFTGALTFTRNAAGLVSGITRVRDGLTYQYQYNSSGQLSSFSDFDGNTTQYAYNQGQGGTAANGLLSSFTDPLGRPHTFTYYDNGKAFEQTEPGNGKWAFFYSAPNAAAENYVTVQDIDGASTQYNLDANGLISEIIHPDDSRTQYSLNFNGSMIETDEIGAVTKTIYDNLGDLLQIQKPSGASLTMLYQSFGIPYYINNSAGTLVSTVDPTTGNITQLQNSETGLALNLGYDTFGNVLSTNNGLASYSNQTDANGFYTTVFDARNPETRKYDNRGRVLTRTFQTGRVLTYTWDNHDRITRVDDTAGPSVIQVWDIMNRLTSRTVTDGSTNQVTQYTWDDRDRLSSITDPMGRTTQIKYDRIALGCHVVDKPSIITDPAGRQTRFIYDIRQRLTQVVDAKGGMTRYDYNPRGDLIGITDPGNSRTSFSYDGDRRLVQIAQPTVITVQDGSVASGTEVTTYGWDNANRLLSETKTNNLNASQSTANFTWDAIGRLIEKQLIQYQNGQQVIQDDSTYTYQAQLDSVSLASANNGVAQLSYASEAVPPFAITSYSVAATDSANPWGLIQDSYTVIPDTTAGNIAGITNQAGAGLFSAQYDPAGRMTKINSGTFISGQALGFTFQYDSFFRKRGEMSTTGLVGSFSWDALNRRTSTYWNGNDGSGNNLATTENLTYDPLTGNINSVAREFGNFTYQYDLLSQVIAAAYSGTQQLGPAVNRSWTYDPAGNRITDSLRGNGTFSSNFELGDSLSQYLPTMDGVGAVGTIVDRPSGRQKNFTYRADEALVQYADSTMQAAYAFDALGRRVAKSINNGTDPAFNQSYVYLADQDKILLGKGGDGMTTLYMDGQGIDEHLGQVSNFTLKANAADHLGSVLNGEAAGGTSDFGAFGENLGTVVTVAPSSNPVMYGFSGRQLDPESGRYYYRAREFDPSTGRFLSKDPAWPSGGINTYSYVLNDPVNLTDPNGENPVLIAVGIGALVGGIANLTGSYIAGTLTRENAAQTFGIGALAGGASVLTAGTATLVEATSLTGILNAELGSGLIGTAAGAGIDLGLTALLNPPNPYPQSLTSKATCP